MKILRFAPAIGLFASALSVSITAASFAQTSSPTAPQTRRDDVSETIHGVTIADPYRWLEDQSSAETRAWIKDENAYTHELLDSRSGRDKLEARFGQLRKVMSIQLPIERSGRYVYRKRLADQDQYVICARNGANGTEETLIDPNPMSADHSTNVEPMDLSRDGKVMAYAMRQGGKDETEIRLFDIDSHHDLADVLPSAVYFDVSLLPDRSAFYYSLMAEDGPRVRLHKMGEDPKQDTEVFGKGYGKDKIAVGDVSEDGKHLVVQVLYGSAADKVEIWTQDLGRNAPLIPLVKDIDARFFAYPGGDSLFLQTNWKAPRGRVLALKFDQPEQSKWQDIVPEAADALEGVALAGGKIFVSYVHNASSVVKVFASNGKPLPEFNFPALGSVPQINGHWEGKEAFATFRSFTVPTTILRYDTETGKQSEWARIEVPVDSKQFEVKQEWFESKDGTRVPMFLVYRRGLKLDGKNPVLLTGYGGFTLSELPPFRPDAVVWAEHGGVFVDVNLRGGGEFGEDWHRAGMREHKQNVFDDFVGAAQWLIKNKYTNPDRLAITGGSNGGLLVGAAMTQHPELFRAVICWHPLLDMLRYQKFMEAQFWVSEYGSADNPDQFKYIYAYSPYQHVTQHTKYPAVLFMTGDGDTRVAPLHARKMAALMQTVATPDRPALLRYELVAGHAGGRSVSQTISDDVDEFSFLFWQLGVEP
ncbi:MAG TPA: prolyl oligopeptidase family serine peptidase [Terriglobales bacterium]|jgi:prolyl oligopeptidase|nr:prolyl oligopeptidase family serine peptidase [Terriglobales bacterium]